jgi:hypothetical protein
MGGEMPVFFCRWPDGDFSIVEAEDEIAAVESLDEFANADGLSLVELPDFRFAMTFRLNDEGDFVFDSVSEYIDEKFWGMYPRLWAAQEKGMDAIKRAVD